MGKRKNNRLIWILVAVVVILIAVAAMLGRNKEQGTKVAVEKAENRTLTEVVTASGRIYPEFEVKISSDVSGEIVELFVEEGDSVTKGQLLLRINPETYQASLERLEANVNASKASVADAKSQIGQVEAQKIQMEAQLENARQVHERNAQLKKDGVIAQVEFDNSATQLKTAEANVKATIATLAATKERAKGAEFNLAAAQASVKEAKENLTRTSIYAPVSGIVSLLNVEKGERVVGTLQMTGTEIMRISNLNTMEVKVDVSENDVLRVALGDEADIEVDAYLDRKFEGKVTEIANSSQTIGSTTSTDQVTNFTVTVLIDPNSYRDVLKTRRFPFRPGMSASVDIKTNTKENVLSIPIQAVTTREREDDNKASTDTEALREVVFLLVGDTVALQDVTTGIQNDEYIEIVKGLKKGDEVVSEPYTAISKTLKSGTKVIKTDKDKLFGRKKSEEK